MSPEEMRARAEECERLAGSLGPSNAELIETMREVAAQWRWLADEAEAQPSPSGRWMASHGN